MVHASKGGREGGREIPMCVCVHALYTHVRACVCVCALLGWVCTCILADHVIYCGRTVLQMLVLWWWRKGGQKTGELGCNFNPHVVGSAVQLFVLQEQWCCSVVSYVRIMTQLQSCMVVY